MENIFNNIITALYTSFNNKEIDYKAFDKLLEKQIEAKVQGVVVAGSTGEGPCLQLEEKKQLLEFAINKASHETKIIFGVSSASTDESLKYIEFTQKLSIDGLMLTVPFYTKPNQRGIIEHFKTLAKETDLPIMIYIHPGRTGVDLYDETINELYKIKNVKAIKEASDDLDRTLRMRELLGDEYISLTGNDPSIIAFMANGGDGSVSVMSNIMPHCLNKICQLMKKGDLKEVQKIQAKYFTITKAIYSDVNPIGIKTLAHLMGIAKEEFRLPLLPTNDYSKQLIKSILPLVIELEEWGRG